MFMVHDSSFMCNFGNKFFKWTYYFMLWDFPDYQLDSVLLLSLHEFNVFTFSVFW